MPELPEVEVTRRSFAAQIAGARVQAVRLGKPLRWPLGIAPQSLVGRQVLQVGRRGKYLLLQLDQGCLLIHLGMSGSLRFAAQLPPLGVHDHFELQTSQGLLRLHDPRRFGAVVWVDSLEAPAAQKLLGGLGLEPLEAGFTAAALLAGMRRSRLPIKQLLLAGKVVVGVGNIYASEALFLARIRPTTSAARIGALRAGRLHAAIGQVLQAALERGGSSLRDFSSADGSAGHFQLDARVYGRQGLPCTVCAAPIQMLRQGQRSTFFCPQCQRP